MSKQTKKTYPTAWSDQDIEIFERDGIEPPKTSNGIWVTDGSREAQPLSDWTLAELYALAMNELFTQQIPGSGEFYSALRAKAHSVDKDVNHWSEDELHHWLLTEEPPKKTENGNFVNDPDRWIKDAAKWNDSELVDLGLGLFGELDRSQEYILDEASERFELPMGITFDDYCAYIKTKVKPEITENGVLVNDRDRERKDLERWTAEELEAWLAGDIVSAKEERSLLRATAMALDGKWYWTKEQMAGWWFDSVEPEVDFTLFSDADLAMISAAGEKAASAVLEERHPPEDVEDVPEVIETVEAATEILTEEEAIEEDVPAVELVRPVIEVVKVMPQWDDVVPMGSPLYDAIVQKTPQPILGSDVKQRSLPASEWPLYALVAWARDEIQAEGVSAKDLTAELRGLVTGDVSSWSDDAVKILVGYKALPGNVEEVVLSTGAVRDKKEPSRWSDKELKAWARGEITSTVDSKAIILAMRVRFDIPDWLSDADVVAYACTGTMPEDPTKVIQDVRSASDAQLDGWVKGSVRAPHELTDDIIKELRVRKQLDPRWSDASIVVFLRDGIKPALTSNNLLVEDRARDLYSPSKWGWEELKALAKQEIAAEFALDSVVAVARLRELLSVNFGIDHKAWSDKEVITYLATDSKPRILGGGVYLNDPSRPLRIASEWSDAELKAWLGDEIVATQKASDDDLWDEVYRRFKIPPAWYRADARSYVLVGTVVPSLPSGIYVRDQHRDHRIADHWTKRELKAWCRGQILPGLVASPEQLIQTVIRLFGVSSLLDHDSIKKRVASITEESMTMTVKFVTEDLASYVKGRTEAGTNVAKAAPYQSLLDRCIGRVLRLENEDFVQGWTELLKFFFAHKNDITSARHLYIGVGQMVITPRGLRQFQNMLTLLQSTCDPQTRDQAVSRVDWSTALKEVTNEKTRQSMLSYYGVH